MTTHPPCARCGHVHRVTSSPGHSDPLTYDQKCECGCTASGTDYERRRAAEIENPYWNEVRPFVMPEPYMPYAQRDQVQSYPGEPPMGWTGPGQREWYHAELARLPKRRDLVTKYAWAVPDPEALDRFMALDLGPLVEVGAGTGYWAWLIEQLGGDVVCYDENPPGDTSAESTNHWHPSGHQWVPVLKAGVWAVEMHQDRALMLCWPPYGDPMAYAALRIYKGAAVVFIGEGDGGCTADDDFFELLGKEWTETAAVELIQWEGIHDRLEVWTRGSADADD